MPEPALHAYTNQFDGRVFRRSRLRDAIGPSNPIFHLLELLCIDSVFVIQDDFPGVLNTDIWTASNSGGAGVANFARLANTLDGVIQGDAGTDLNADVRLFMTSNEVFTLGNRPMVMARYQFATVTTLKYEFGLADGVGAGAVNVKATPTSTATDYAVVIFDTDDDTRTTMITDGTTDAAGAVDATPAYTTAATTYQTTMLAGNERRECAFWVDGVFRGVRRAGPNTATSLGIWFYCQNRSGASHTMDIDYVLGMQERTAI